MIENITRAQGFMVNLQEASEFAGICSCSYTSVNTQNPDSRGFCCVSVQSSGFLVLRSETTHENSGVCLVRLRSIVLHNIHNPVFSCRVRSRETN